MTLRSNVLSTDRHTTHYLSAGNPDDPPVIFVHGWPELSLSWRNQLPFIADLGYFAVAPDMRGYGKSSVYNQHADYALTESIQDMLELLDHLGKDSAIWVGHDWGSPVVWSLARHHPGKCRAVANLCVPYATLELGWDGLLPYIDRSIYPKADFPAGQWDYQCFYEENFEAATSAFDAAPYNVMKALFQKGNPASEGQPAITAFTRQHNGWFGGMPVPDVPRDDDIISEEDLQTYANHLKEHTFFGPDSWYMNHEANAAYGATKTDDDLSMPVMFLHARYDSVCATLTGTAAEPMRQKCANLTEHIVDTGHWMAQEKPDEVNQHLQDWLAKQVN